MTNRLDFGKNRQQQGKEQDQRLFQVSRRYGRLALQGGVRTIPQGQQCRAASIRTQKYLVIGAGG